MWPFKRNTVDITGMPPEVHEYYQAEHRERVGVAWLLAGATLTVTVLLALGVFFGGRAIYHKVNKHNNGSESTQVSTKSNPAAVAPKTSGNQPTNKSTASSNAKSGQVSNQAAVTTKPSPASTPANNSNLPHTGPDGDD